MLGSWVRVPSGSPHGANALARARVCAILFLAQPEQKGGDGGYRANRSSRVTCWSTILAFTPGLTPNVVTNVLNNVLYINALAIKKENPSDSAKFQSSDAQLGHRLSDCITLNRPRNGVLSRSWQISDALFCHEMAICAVRGRLVMSYSATKWWFSN